MPRGRARKGAPFVVDCLRGKASGGGAQAVELYIRGSLPAITVNYLNGLLPFGKDVSSGASFLYLDIQIAIRYTLSMPEEAYILRCSECKMEWIEIYPEGLLGDESRPSILAPKSCDCDSQYEIVRKVY